MISPEIEAVIKAIGYLESEVRDLKSLLLLLATKLTTENGSRLVTQEELGKALGLTDRGVRHLLNKKQKRNKKKRE